MRQGVYLAILFMIAISAVDLRQAAKAAGGSATTDRTASGSIPGGPFQEVRAANSGCAAGQAASGDLGYSGTECHGCFMSGKHQPGKPDIEFDAEPIISGIRQNGPADGKLEEKDVLVAIDGQPITTRPAAVQLSWLEPDKPVRVTVRRDGVITDVEIVPVARCRKVTQDLPAVIILRRRLLS
ncbi:MAG TPA: PDZ domain-containing protein [Pyrinomonadaceae bacterium]|nr:PDZ domain-containing protein [Pyrinomonadaceae bacterium]